MVCRCMALSGLLVLVVQHIGKISLPEGGSMIFYFLHIMRSTNTIVIQYVDINTAFENKSWLLLQ